jgi:predicted nucleic acid-binding protein
VPIIRSYLDSNAFISYLEGSPQDSTALNALFESLSARPGAGITSELTLAEVLAGSNKSAVQMKRAYLDLMVFSRNFDLISVSREVLYQSADLCSVHKRSVGRKLGLLDAIHLATASQTGCQYFVSADKSIVPPAGIVKIGFDPNEIEKVCKALA